MKGLAARLFGADLRALAAMRIALGLVVLADLFVRAQNLFLFYGSRGVLPVPLWRQFFAPGMLPWSLHLLFGGPAWWLWLLLAVHVLAAAALLVGWRTRIATPIVWFLTLSLQNANPFLDQGGDVLLATLLLIGCFLPLGAVWSVDAWRARKAGASADSGAGDARTQFVSAWTAALFLQFAFLYLFAALQKDALTWAVQTRGVYDALMLDQDATRLAPYLLRFPAFVTALSVGIFYFQRIAPFVLFVPWRRNLLRHIVLPLLVLMHLSFTLFLHIGLFSFVSVAGLLAFVPGAWWDALERALARNDRGKGRTVTQTAWSGSILANGLGIAFIVVVLFWNVASLFPANAASGVPAGVPTPFAAVFMAAGLRQNWHLFVLEDNGATDGWFVMPAQLADGSQVDVFRSAGLGRTGTAGVPVSYARPENPASLYPNERWRRYLNHIALAPAPFRARFGDLMCARWNASHAGSDSARMTAFERIYMSDPIPAPGTLRAPAKSYLLLETDCKP